jgi:hypothetical protein
LPRDVTLLLMLPLERGWVYLNLAAIMTIKSYKRLTIILIIACAGLIVLSSSLFWHYGWLKVQVAFANEQTKIFGELRTQALNSDITNAAGCLAYVVSYYPSGSKQDADSRLDRIVERDRALAVQDIISFLRKKTGEDLGDNPQPWIQKYSKK